MNKNKGDKFIDLSGVPKKKNTNFDWEKSIGMHFDFVYNGICGEIVVLDYDKSNGKIRIFIENYTGKDGRAVYTSRLRTCELDRIFTTKVVLSNPEIIKFLKYPDDACKYTKNQNNKVTAVCPSCGREKECSICDLVRSGFHCDWCDDGISYPNKFMRSLLKQTGIDFIPEVSKVHSGFEWAKKYKYDFYFEKDDKKYFVEMDGGFHYQDVFGMLESVRESDLKKEELSRQHNIELIRIDCNYKRFGDRFDYIKSSILNSKLNDLFDLNKGEIDWDLCNSESMKSILYSICNLWNDGVQSTNQIANCLKLSRATVGKYLRMGNKMGITDYDGSEIQAQRCRDRNKILGQQNKKPLVVYKDELLIGIFAGCIDLANNSFELFGRRFCDTIISKACKGDIKRAYGYTMKYIDKNQFKQLAGENSFLLVDGGESLEIAI